MDKASMVVLAWLLCFKESLLVFNSPLVFNQAATLPWAPQSSLLTNLLKFLCKSMTPEISHQLSWSTRTTSTLSLPSLPTAMYKSLWTLLPNHWVRVLQLPLLESLEVWSIKSQIMWMPTYLLPLMRIEVSLLETLSKS